MISLVVATDRNRAIGRQGGIPWHIPADLKFFSRETTGTACIMGRRTWESLPERFRPLPNRLNLVVSSGAPEGAEHVHRSIDSAIAAAHAAGYAHICGIGGAGIYEALLPRADRLVITEVDLAVEDADTWFPEYEAAEWVETTRFVLQPDDPRCEVVELLRKR